MTKIAAVVAIMMTGAVALLAAGGQPWNEKSATATLDADSQVSGKIDDMIVEHLCFQNTLNAMLDLLANEQIHLADACGRVHESALRNYPAYLRDIEISDPAPTARERIARNLIGHLQRIEENDSKASSRMRALELELAVLH